MLENSFLSKGLSNFPEASRGNIESEKYICSGILKAANLSAKNNFRSSDVMALLSLNTIEAHKISPSLSSGIPNTHASRISECSYIAPST